MTSPVTRPPCAARRSRSASRRRCARAWTIPCGVRCTRPQPAGGSRRREPHFNGGIRQPPQTGWRQPPQSGWRQPSQSAWRQPAQTGWQQPRQPVTVPRQTWQQQPSATWRQPQATWRQPQERGSSRSARGRRRRRSVRRGTSRARRARGTTAATQTRPPDDPGRVTARCRAPADLQRLRIAGARAHSPPSHRGALRRTRLPSSHSSAPLAQLGDGGGGGGHSSVVAAGVAASVIFAM